MAFLFLIAFITVPVVEIAVFIQVGERIGLWPTIAIVILTAIMGTAMLRQQGLSVLFRIQENLAANRIPVQELFDGVCLVIAGALLLTPGFVTDSIGFLLFIAPLRRRLAAEIGKRFVASANVRYASGHQHTSGAHHEPEGRGPIIDGDYQDITRNDDPSDPAGPQITDGTGEIGSDKPDR